MSTVENHLLHRGSTKISSLAVYCGKEDRRISLRYEKDMRNLTVVTHGVSCYFTRIIKILNLLHTNGILCFSLGLPSD